MRTIGPFELQHLIARGGMGEVWMARHAVQEVDVALKLLPGDEENPDRIAAFHVEARAIASLDHPGIVLVFDYGEIPEEDAARSEGQLTAGRPWIAMEYVDGGTLATVARTITWPETRRFLDATLDALAHAHARGVIHRDLKVGNVLRSSDGRYKLTDFGIAHLQGETEGRFVQSGTPSVMAPEQFEGRWRDFGPWTDLYSLGALAWMVVAGERPYPGRTWAEQAYGHLQGELRPLQARCAVPVGFEAWLRRLLAKDPARRYRCAADAAWALARLVDPPVVGTMPTPPQPPDHTTLVHDGVTESTSHTGWGVGEGTSYRPRVAPMPGRWRARDAPARPARIVGAGLGLWGLRTLPLVGREQERDRLWNTLLDVRNEERSAVAVIRGPSGVGKSRLAAWLVERARELGAATVLDAVHDADAGPMSGLGPMVDRALVLGGMAPEARRERIRAILVGLGAPEDDTWLVETLDRLEDRSTRRSPAERHHAVVRLIELLARERPVLLLLDDAQWGLDALACALAVRRSALPVLVVLTVADEALVERPAERALVETVLGLPDTVKVALGPLPQHDRTPLLRHLLGLSPTLARMVDARTDGNPMFAIQVVGDWIHGHLLEPGPEGFTLAPGAPAMLPTTLREVWDRRLLRFLDQRPSDDAAALRVAALLGREIQTAEWLAACAELGVHPSDHLARDLVVRRLASAEDPRLGWAFVHGLLREAVEASIAEDDRSRMHLACAHAIADDERRGRHLLRARAFDEAASPLLEGALRALVRADFPRATELIADADRALEASAIPADDRRWGRRLFVACALAQQRSDLELGDELARRMMHEAELHGWSQERGHALSALGRAALMRWDLPQSIAYFLEAKDICVAENEVDGELACLRGLAAATIYAGDLDQAEIWVGQMKDKLRPDASALVHGGHHLMVATMAQARLRLPEAIDEMRQALRHFERCGDRMGYAAALGTIASCQRDLGDIAAARATYVEATDLTRDIGTNLDGILRMGFGLIRCMDGEPQEGLALIRGERERLIDTGQLHHLPRCELYLATALAELGDPSASVPLERALDGLLAPPVVHTDTAVLLERAATDLDALGHRDLAARAREAAASTWRRLGNVARADALAGQ
ncbi:MAG: protein kinase [Alphaproteobacteria bacterium]|nr:protein kinase [Alphaproteobacteria bacterium]MCB9699046.1 protein kinase [Alphaproteobacteria bacterium]